jgi:uncharacterized membrane protein HdeD (DUF308 family)
MFWSGTSPLAVVRRGMWAFLVFAGVAWLALGWSVLRLEPPGIAAVTGSLIMFGALVEAVRACAAGRTWWLNAGMAVLFAATGAVLWAAGGSSPTTPVALAGWYLLVRGAADVAVPLMSRETERGWALVLVVGVLEVGLGFFAAGPYARTAEVVFVVVGALGVLRGVADLVGALEAREAPPADLLAMPPERAAGVAGYSAGRTDFAAGGQRGTRPRHRAQPRSSAASAAAAMSVAAVPAAPPAGAPESFHEEVLRTTADLDAVLALAGVTGAAVGATPPEPVEAEVPENAAALDQAAAPPEPPRDDAPPPIADETRAAAEAAGPDSAYTGRRD